MLGKPVVAGTHISAAGLILVHLAAGTSVDELIAGHGFTEVRRRGSHSVMQKAESDSTVTVPVPNPAELNPGILRSIIRQSGIDKTEFESG